MIRIGDSTVMLVDEMPEWGALGPRSLKGSPVAIHLYVEDVDAVAAQAVRAGAKTTMPVSDMFWGDRYGQIEDPFGHRWSIATHVHDVAPADMQKAMQQQARGRMAARPQRTPNLHVVMRGLGRASMRR
jgi:PhnB protein